MLRDFLSEKRTAILKRWQDLILETYPPDAARFFKQEKDSFANPVGSSITRALAGLFEELLGGGPGERIAPLLDDIIRIRAVQDFSPSRAIAFIFQLKGVIRAEVTGEGREPRFLEELLEFESAIDRLALQAFDVYLQCREQIFDIRVKEARAWRGSALPAGERGKGG